MEVIGYIDAIPRMVLETLSAAYQGKSSEPANSLQTVWEVSGSIGSIEQTYRYPAGS